MNIVHEIPTRKLLLSIFLLTIVGVSFISVINLYHFHYQTIHQGTSCYSSHLDFLLYYPCLLLVICCLSVFLIWLVTRRGLKNIEYLAREVVQRSPDRLGPITLKTVSSWEVATLTHELNKLFLRLKQAVENEHHFASDAAHELRTPLAALRTQAQAALKTNNHQERQMCLQQVLLGVDRCTHIIQQLLTLSRLNAETVTSEHMAMVDLSKIASEVIAQFAPAAIAKRIDIELITDSSNCKFLGNATGLYTLIRNLVDNAIYHTPEGGAVKTLISATSTHVSLRVTDTGPGIPPELYTRVFERFYRARNTNSSGSGLGLTIVRQIAILHKGDVTLSAPETGHGLEVEVVFPLFNNVGH